MHLLFLEIKRILSSRSSQIAIGAAVLFSILLAYVPITFVYYYNPEEQKFVSGLQAINDEQAMRSNIEGAITQEDITNAITKYQAVLNKYGVDSRYKLPNEGSYEIEDIKPLLHMIEEAYGSEDGLAANILDLSTNELTDFYETCSTHLANNMILEQKDHPAAQSAAVTSYSKVSIPFSYYYGISSSAIEYEGLLIALVLFCCTIVCAPVFSTEYQTGSDNILRCTKYGRKELAITKIFSAIIISSSVFLICFIVWFGLTMAFWGTKGLHTSLQILFTVIGLIDGNAMHLIFLLAACSLIMLISSICLTLFISSKASGNMVSLAIAFLVSIMPLMLTWFIPSNIACIVKALFPTGGIGLNNGLLYDLLNFNFLNIGNIAIWTPYMIVGVACLEIPLWIFMTIRNHNKHVAK